MTNYAGLMYPPGADSVIPGLESWMEVVRSNLANLDQTVLLSGDAKVESLYMYQDSTSDVYCVANVNSNTTSAKFKMLTSGYPTDAQIAAETAVAAGGITRITSNALGNVVPGTHVYIGVIAYNASNEPSLTAYLEGTPAGIYGQPTYQISTSVSGDIGTALLTLNDPNGLVTKVEFRSKQGNGAWSAWAEDASAPYSADVTLVEGEVSKVGFRVTYDNSAGGSSLLEDEIEFHGQDTAVVNVPTVTVEGTNARVDYFGDHNTATIWRKDRGAAFGTGTQIGTGRTATELIALTGSRQDFDAYGKNDGGSEGPVAEFSVPPTQSFANLSGRLLDNITGGVLQVGLLQDSAGLVGLRVDADDTLPTTWLRYIDFGGSGVQPFIYHENFELRHDGTAIFAGDLAAGTVVAGDIAAGAVNASNIIASGIITTSHMTAGTINADRLSAGTITSGLIGAGQIITSHMTAGAIDADRLVAGSITAGLIGADQIVAGKLAVGSIDTADLFVAGVINAAAIGANAVVAGKINANAVTAGTIAANAVEAGDIAAGAINASNIIATGVIITTHMAAGTINADRLTTGSVTATQIQAGTITGTQITGSTLAAIYVDAGIISAGRLDNSVTPTAGVRLSSGYSKPAGWTRYIDLAGSGTDPFLKHENLSVLYDGTVRVNGEIYWNDDSEWVAMNDLYNLAWLGLIFGMRP